MALLVTSLLAALLVTVHGCNYPNLSASTFRDQRIIHYLFLDDCSLTHIPKGVFKPIPTLSSLSLNQNNIAELRNSDFEGLVSLEYLNLNNNRLTSLPDDFLRYMPSLEQLFLNENQLTHISSNVLRGSNLTELHVEYNLAPLTLASRALADMPRLQVIKLVNCSITSLPADLLDNSNAVKEIYLAENYIQELPEDLFANKVRLEKLYLNDNKLRALSSRTFASLHNLEILHLNDNEIFEMDVGTFSSLTKLKRLLLRNNRLRSVPADAFPLSLTTLRLDNNELTTFETRLLPAIRTLSLSHNSFSSVPRNWPDTLPAPEMIDLSYNAFTRLSESDMTVLSHYPRTYFDLEDNKITTILVNPRMIGPLDLWLRHAPLRCDCSMHGFATHLHNKIQKVHDAYCAQPASFVGMRINDVPLTDFVCHIAPCPNTCTCVVRPESKALEVECREQLTAEQVAMLETLRRQHYSSMTENTSISYITQ